MILEEVMRLRSIGAAALLVVVAALSRPAAAETTICTQITSVPWTISTPGVYCLNSDLNFAQSSGVAITIKASNVTLDLNRHVLSNSYVGICSSSATCSNAYGISVEYQSNVLIKNGGGAPRVVEGSDGGRITDYASFCS
jgi:hypothetical protein